MKKQLYTVSIVKNDSVKRTYRNIISVSCDNGLFAMQRGEHGKDKEYYYYPLDNVDYVHVIEENE